MIQSGSSAKGQDASPDGAAEGPHVGLFVTCIVDLFRPNVGFASVKLLQDAGCRVTVPPQQVCCGQPAYNSGDDEGARRIAKQVIAAFSEFDYVVGPSGSCMATICKDYPDMFAHDAEWKAPAQNLAARSHELLSFLNDVLGATPAPATYQGRAAYHDSCSGLRKLGVKEQPRALLAHVEGLSIAEIQDGETCCGFGGTFCVKYPEISTHMVSDKIANVEATGADTVLGGDLGCLFNIAGRLKRLSKPTKVFHAAEVLAGMTDIPAIGEPEQK